MDISNLLQQNWFNTTLSFLLGSIVTYIFYKRSITKPEPCYAINNRILIANTKMQFGKNLKVLYEDREIEKLCSTKIIFWNDGKKTICGCDIVEKEPLRFVFDKKNVQILKASIIQKTRSAINPQVSINPNIPEVSLSFDFLDYDDGVVIEILHTDLSNDIEVKGTIIGIPEGIKMRRDHSKNSYKKSYLIFRSPSKIIRVSFGFFFALFTLMCANIYFLIRYPLRIYEIADLEMKISELSKLIDNNALQNIPRYPIQTTLNPKTTIMYTSFLIALLSGIFIVYILQKSRKPKGKKVQNLFRNNP